jgi:hypothetical protein
LGLSTLLLFGVGAWSDFIQVTLPAQVAITSDPASYLPIAHSVRDRLAIAGLDLGAARIVQALVACLALAAVVIAFRRSAPPAHRLFVLAAGTVAALPYVAIYDQAVVAIAALAVVAADPRLERSAQALLLLLWASPVVDLWLTMSGLPQVGPFVGPIAVLMLLAEGSRVTAALSRPIGGVRP